MRERGRRSRCRRGAQPGLSRMDNSRDRWWARLGSNQRPYRPRKRVGRGRCSI